MKLHKWIIAVCLLLAGCQTGTPSTPVVHSPTLPGPALPTLGAVVTSTSAPPATSIPTAPLKPSSTPLAPTRTVVLPTPTPLLVPNFKHVVVMFFENKEYESVIGNGDMPNFNRLAQENVLLSQYYAIRHPSLPNYIALIGGDTFGITSDNPGKTIDAPSLPDLIEASGRTWKTYQEHMPTPCDLTDTLRYVQKHNPFIWFNPIRDDTTRCQRSVVPLTDLDADLASGSLPNFVFIMPDECNSAHDSFTNPQQCGIGVMDTWLGNMVKKLQTYQPLNDNGLIVITWDEGQGSHTCCGLPAEIGGGRVATILISGLAKPAFNDSTPYTHYSMLKTISQAWGLKPLGHAADPEQVLITAPWK